MEGPRPIRVFGEASDEATGNTNPLVAAVERLNPSQNEFVLDLEEFEVDDGYPLTQCVNAVRELLVRGARLTIRRPPHVLVDGLTRAGLLLPPSHVLLEEVRSRSS
ncbi:MAG TPA: hypothetical protein VKF32_01425 [Thermoanaerobaculia bacterium]|nr:hypothetical protein [Thermoanaerobaculia bacterium]